MVKVFSLLSLIASYAKGDADPSIVHGFPSIPFEFLGVGGCNTSPTADAKAMAKHDAISASLNGCEIACNAERSCTGVEWSAEQHNCQLIYEDIIGHVPSIAGSSECHRRVRK